MEQAPAIAEILMQALRQTCEVFYLTDADGTIIYVNPAFEELTGYSSEEAIGKTARILKSGEHSEEFYRGMWAILKSGRRWQGRLVNRRKDGSTYLDDQRICPIKDASGEIRHFLSIRHDITKERELEEQLNQSQKMESLGLLAGQISHDFNNLLTVMIGSMELISEELQQGSVGHKLATEVLRSSKEAGSLIKQLMVFARRQDDNPMIVSLNEPLREMKLLLDSLLGKNISAAYSLDEDLSKTKIEPERFKQVVMNLAVNARDAMNGAGGIMFRTYNAGPETLPPGLPAGNYAAFELADTGPGIPKDILPRIFEPFFTTKPKGKGTGLGLSSVYGIVTQAGGHVLAANRPAGGAVFSVYFPAV
ncbi:MAG: two-component system sensor histidine kinase NtrB [Elusimicrobiales bacterium]